MIVFVFVAIAIAVWLGAATVVVGRWNPFPVHTEPTATVTELPALRTVTSVAA